MSNKTALVTGGTSGVGLSLVRSLADSNYNVFFIGTNSEKGKKIEAALSSNSKGAIHFIPLDLSDLKKVNEFAHQFCREHGRLDLLANIAGVILPERQETTEGIEKTFAIGYLSPFVLIHVLSPLLEETKQARVLNVGASPSTILKHRLDFEDLNFTKNYNGFKTSIATVHAKTVLTSILAEKQAGKKIDFNSFHPGMVKSQLTRNLPLAMRIVSKLLVPFMSGSSKSAVYAGTSEEIRGITGKIFVNKKAVSLDFDKKYKESLWSVSQEMMEKLVRPTTAQQKKPNYKIGWVVPQKIAGLTHFHSKITQEDINGVFKGTHELLHSVKNEFHLIIDNRMAPLEHIFSLQELQQFSPFLKHPFLKYLVVVKPGHLALDKNHSEIQEENGVLMKNVSTVQEGLEFLLKRQAINETSSIDKTFFPDLNFS
jgi:NAD(P)-dependent dehydrogenase (short-subunit alcohol dehydrogenase family)